jgi:hypothetical protein
LLFVWALGAAIGPTTGTYAIELTTPRAFFVYVIALTLGFTLFTIWRLYRRRVGMAPESREDFLAYPQTSPEIYAWLPYHKEAIEPTTPDELKMPDASVDEPAPTAVDDALPPTA